MKIKNITEKFIKISDKIEKKRKDIKKNICPDVIDLGSRSAREYLEESKKINDELIVFLDKLSSNQLHYISALMYGGRDSSAENFINFNMLLNSAKDSKKIMIETIVGKAPRSKYLREGLRLYSDYIE